MRIIRTGLISLSLVFGALGATPVAAAQCSPQAPISTVSKVGRFSDASCREFFVDAAHPATSPAASIAPNANVVPPAAPADAFALHSRKGAAMVIYLDVDGFVWGPGTWWDTSFPSVAPNLEGRVSRGFDRDGDPTTFTTSERQDVIDIWSGLAEDFAVFDVDVTTEVPTGADAEVYNRNGALALVLTDEELQKACSCGGIAHLDAISKAAPDVRPALNFARFSPDVTTENYDIAEIAAHELGHNFGLVHDGTSTDEYYSGMANWSPIMGAGRGAGIVTWSAGGYPDSKTRAPQYSDDDFVTIARFAPLLADDVGDTIETATDLQTSGASLRVMGLINSAADKDVYRIVVPPGSTGTWTIDINSMSAQPNLDPELQLLDSTGGVIATSNPRVAIGRQWGVIKNGLDASITFPAIPGTYFARIDGVGQDSIADATGYSDYGSVGNFQLQVGTPLPSVESVSLASGGPGTAVTISGFNLAQAAAVKFAGVESPKFSLIASGQIVASVPVGAGIGAVTIVDQAGRTYTAPGSFDARGLAVAPMIDGVSDRAPVHDTVVIISGPNVGVATSLTVGGAETIFKVISASAISFTTRLFTRGGDIVVTTPGGTFTDRAHFLPRVNPIVDSVSPASARPGETVTIRGANFTDVTLITWNGLPLVFSYVSDSELTFLAGFEPVTAALILDGKWGMNQTPIDFTVQDFRPRITSLSRTQVPIGTTLEIKGEHLSDVTILKLNDMDVSFSVVSDSMIRLTVPSGTGSGYLYLESIYGAVTSERSVSVLPGLPSLTSISTKLVRRLDVITVKGKNFSVGVTATIGGIKATVKRVSSTVLKVTVPKTARTGLLQIKTKSGSVKSASKITVRG